MASLPVPKDIDVLNPGFTREALRTLPLALSPGPSYPPWAGSIRATAISRELLRPWAILEWWESRLQARQGIVDLWHVAFLRVRKASSSEQWPVPARMLYLNALGPNEEDPRVEEAAEYIVALIRQARDYYTAAQSVGVSALSRPVLYFYGAMCLARAVVVAVGGVSMLENSGHGLNVEGNQPSAAGEKQGNGPTHWPTLVGWQPKGEFAAFYRMTRWDTFYRPHKPNWQPKSGWPKFHILECLRCLDVDWGVLPGAVFNQSSNSLPSSNGFLLLPYKPERPLERYLTPEIPALERSFFEVPQAVIEYMSLKYFADLARYHPLAWQELLEGATVPEGYVFRVALDVVAADYLRNIVLLLPLPGGDTMTAKQEWIARKPSIDQWYEPPKVTAGHHTILLPPHKRLPVWHGPEEHSEPGVDGIQHTNQASSDIGSRE